MQKTVSMRLLVVLVIPALIIAACDVIDPVDPIVNNAAHEPSINILDIHEITPGQHIAGSFYVNADIDSSYDSIAWVALYVDDMKTIRYSPPWMLLLHTSGYPEGEHTITIGLREATNNCGLLGVGEVPTIIFSAPVIFDQTPPTPVVLDSVIWVNGSPKLFWQESPDANFYAYVPQYSGNFSPLHADSVFNRQTTSCLDTLIPPIYGLDIECAISVTNRAEYSAGNSISLSYGDILSETPICDRPTRWDQQPPKPVLNPIHDILYVVEYINGSYNLKAYSTLDHSYIGGIYDLRLVYGVAVSRDGAKLYVIDVDSYALLELDAMTLAVNDSFAGYWLFESDLVAGRENRLYICNDVAVQIIDASAGAPISQTVLRTELDQYIDFNHNRIAIATDNNALYVDGSYEIEPGNMRSVICRLDVSGDTAIVDAIRDLGEYPIIAWQLSPDDNDIYVVLDSLRIETLDPVTLATTGQIELPVSDDSAFISDISVTDDHIYVSIEEDIPGVRYSSPGVIYKYDKTSMSLLDSWMCIRYPLYAVPSSDETTVYTFGSYVPSFIIPTQQPFG